MDVKPWEPVGHSWYGHRIVFRDPDIAERLQTQDDVGDTLSVGTTLTVTLANNQRIIVRALSEERKAARAVRKAAERACYEAAYAQARAIERGPYGNGDQ